MEVPRRIELMPVAPIQKKETKKETAPTIRFNLDLAEPTEKTCTEFSYEELLRNALVSCDKMLNLSLIHELRVVHTKQKYLGKRIVFFCV